MNSLNIYDLLDGHKPIDRTGNFFVIGVADYDPEDFAEYFEDNEYTSCSLETLIRERTDCKIVKRFKEVHNPKYLGDEFGMHLLQPALIAFKPMEGK